MGVAINYDVCHDEVFGYYKDYSKSLKKINNIIDNNYNNNNNNNNNNNDNPDRIKNIQKIKGDYMNLEYNQLNDVNYCKIRYKIILYQENIYCNSL